MSMSDYYKNYLSQKDIKNIFEYNTELGILEWRALSKGRLQKVGSINKKGYLVVGIHNKKYNGGKRFSYRIHVLIWIYHNGEIPEGYEVDHLNHLKCDNRIENLRLVAHTNNCKNKSIGKSNKSGFNGVHWCKTSNKWVSSIRVNQKLFHLGRFKKKEDAIKARKEADVTYGFHLNHGN